MALISGDVGYQTVVVVVAASSGDGDTIAAMFNGIYINGVSTVDTATAANSSGTVTITWDSTDVRAADMTVLGIVAARIAEDTTLTSPITLTVATRARMTA